MKDLSNFENLCFHGNLNVIDRFSTCFPMHWHNYIEIICIPSKSNNNQNNASYLFVTINNTTHHLKPGDILIIWPGELHEILSGSGADILGIQFTSSLLNERPEFSSNYNTFRNYHHIQKCNFPNITEEMSFFLHEIESFNKIDDYYKGVNMIISLYKCFLTFARYVNIIHKKNSNNASSINIKTIKKIHSVCNYINKNCSHDLSLDYVASFAGFSSYYFSRTFKQVTSCSFVEYVTNQRIRLAQQLLSDSSHTITEIAYLSGFKSIATFNRVFKNHKGYSPREFRTFYLQE
ncbi:MAG: AraC family transcriptional regulator [Clostridium butyricum]|nr:AraC family transcriptional regulator [Clostridium butyricum]